MILRIPAVVAVGAAVASLSPLEGAEAVASGSGKSGRDHWAFRPVGVSSAPPVANAAWPRTDIDRFLLARMEAAGVTPAGDAPPVALCRRAHFVLTGLPPDPQDVRAFLAAAAESGVEKALAGLVDALLGSPHFGERWARHWMDVMRYADGKGSEYDYPIPGAWRYRDYLIRAINADLPADQFLREHLIGDLLPPRIVDGRNEALLATAWWQLGESVNSPVDLPGDEAERMDNQIDVLGRAFHGLTLACARCHDHKFDPVTMRDYYGLFGIAAASPLRRTWANGPALDEWAAKLRRLRDAHDAAQPPPAPAAAAPLDIRDGELLGDFAVSAPDGWIAEGGVETVTAAQAPLRGVFPGLWSGLLSRKIPGWVRSPVFVIEHDFLNILAAGENSMIQVVIGNYHLIKNPLYGHLKGEIQTPGQWKWHRVPIGRWKGMRCTVEIHTGKTHTDFNVLGVEDAPNARFGLRAVVLTNGAELPAPPCVMPQNPHPWPCAPEIEAQIPPPERFLGVSEAGGWDAPVFDRGEATKPLPVTAPRGYFELFGALRRPVLSGSGRRELADAVVSPENPLTARVYVNRLWAHVFGRGIVETADNFGGLGTPPSHPELLDHLAHRFMHVHHWSTKAALREMLLSHAWRTATQPPPECDPDNRLLSVHVPRRLEAECIRDAMLAAAQTLDRSLGGPPVPVPHRLAHVGPMEPQSGPVDGNRRRSIYLEQRRNHPNRFLDVFDRPPALAPVGRREVTNVPAQALALLNDPFVLGQAEAWGRRMRDAPGTEDDRLAEMHLRAFGRPAAAEEIRRLRDLLEDPAVPENWSAVALAIFNQKEFIHVP
jgi:hypothetical protein